MKPSLSVLATLVLALGPLSTLTAQAAPGQPDLGPDLGKEQRWREQIVDSLMEGEAVDLQAGDLTFLGIYTESSGGGDPPKGAAILVHGIGVHPDWPQVIHPLRVGLPERGWSTLSIQMPVLGNEAQPADYLPLLDGAARRLDAAVDFLRERGAGPIVIVAHSLGATMAGDYLGTHPRAVAAYVAIGMSAGTSEARLDNAQTVGRIQVPTLDLYGQNDLDAVIGTAAARVKAAVEGGNRGYNQVQVPGADHFFEGQDEALLDTMTQWLDQTLNRRLIGP
jgi:pimeloyl-ACP methyl ester carboxylesterase